MVVLGDDIGFLMNVIGYNLLEVFGGQEFGIVAGLVMFALLAYLALAYKLDRGALVFLGVLVVGTMMYFSALPATVWWAMLGLASLLAVYGITNLLRQGEG